MFDAAGLFEEFERLEPIKRESYVRAPFGYPGGKWRSLQYLLPNLPVRSVWVDVCGGSGVVSLNRPKSQLEIFNDRHSGITAFYRCLRDPNKSKKLQERLSLVLHSREEFIWSRDSWRDCAEDIERAARWFYTVKFSFQSLGRNFGRCLSGNNMLAAKYWEAVDELLNLHPRIKNWQVENLDATQCIRDFDSPDTVTYIDPDYIGAFQCYEDSVDHKALIQGVREGRGFFAVSGYANQLYDSQTFWDERLTWRVAISATAQVFNEGNGLANKINVMGRDQTAEEVLWIKESK